MYQFAINDYIAIKQGYSQSKNKKLIKKKGMFLDEVTIGKGMDSLIIPKAIINYFADKVPIEETIRNCRNIHDFITYQKVSKDFSVEYNGKLIQRINRYYMSTNGPWLYKCKVDSNGIRSNYINLCTDSGVTIVNQLNDNTPFPTNINYQSKARKIINSFNNQQLSLF